MSKRAIISAVISAIGLSSVTLWGANSLDLDMSHQTSISPDPVFVTVVPVTQTDALRASDIFELYEGRSKPVSSYSCDFPVMIDEPVFSDIKSQKPKPNFRKIDIDLNPTESAYGTHVIHIPAKIPPRFLRGDASGYCRMTYDISAEGVPMNVAATICTDDSLKDVSIKSVRHSRYDPIARFGEEISIRFDLIDEKGSRLPLPLGF